MFAHRVFQGVPSSIPYFKMHNNVCRLCELNAYRHHTLVCFSRCCVLEAHLFKQSEDVEGEEAHGCREDESRLLQVGHVALVGARQVHHRVHQGVPGVRQAGRYRSIDGCSIKSQ